MSKDKISQREINEICIEIGKQGEDISIDKVKKLLGKGTHSDITPKVILFKEDKPTAILLAQEEVNPQINTNKDVSENDHLLHHLSIEIKNILSTFSHEKIDQSVLNIRQTVEQYIKDKIRQTPNIYYQNKPRYDEEDMKDHIDHLEKQNQALISKYKSLEQKIKILEHEKKQLLTQSTENNQSSSKNRNNEQTEESIHNQIQQLNGDRRAAFSEKKVTIYLYTTDFSTTLIKELKKGKKGRHQAISTFNYKSKLWEITNFNLTTIQFLFTNGFDISEHLIQYAQKLKRQQTLQDNN
ncbi:hypothetical protein OAO18_08685 [Francisellaceae bacterium]|nr:hypothetical protein [Francisellaceae bacterium]